MGNSRKQPNILKTAIVFLIAAAIILLVVIMVKSGIDRSRVEPDPTQDVMAATEPAEETECGSATDAPEVTGNGNTDVPATATPYEQSNTEAPTQYVPATEAPTQAPAVTATPSPSPTPSPTPTPTPTPTPKPTPTPTPTPTAAAPTGSSGVTNAELLAMERKNPSNGTSGLIISEIMTSNTQFAPQNGEYYDWVEIYNAGSDTVRLSDYTLTDRMKKPDKFRLPDRTLAPGGYYLIFCTGEGTANRASFKLSSDGESVYLYKNGELQDSVDVPLLVQNTSYARYGTSWIYSVVATPEGPNAAGRTSLLSPPVSNVASGCYQDPVTITLSGPGTVYYTTDGTAPTTSSKVANGSITVTKPTSFRTICVSGGEQSPESYFTYIVDKTATTLPVVNIAADLDSLSAPGGVFSDQHQPYKGTEAPILLTLVENGEVKFSVPCGFKLHGNDSRYGAKQNFRLRFKSVYGVSKLRYKVFENREIYEFDSLLLKSGSEDFTRTIMRDELTTSLVDGTTTLFVQAYRPVTLYIDGEYWGIYYLRERLDEDYVEDHTGWDSSTVDVIKSLGELDAGSMTDFYDVRRFCNSHDMTVAENYEYACSRIDIDNVIDWYVCRSYFSDHDISNIRMFRSPAGDNKWHYMFYDLDWSLDSHFVTEGSFTWIVEHTEDSFFQRLMLNATFREKLLRRIGELRKTVLNETHILAEIDHIADMIRPEIERDRVRWGIRQGKWYENLEELKDYFRNGRRDTAYVNDLKSFFGLSASELVSQYGFENVS